MITDEEITEYRALYASLKELHEKYREKKRELRELLQKTVTLRKDALLALAKANRLTLYLTGRQRQITGLTYQLSEIRARINQGRMALFQDVGGGEEGETLPELCDCGSRRELKQRGLFILGMIDDIRKKLLQLNLLELRCRELIVSINKALQAFHHGSKLIRRNLYPFGIFSVFYRMLRGLWGAAYFSHDDMEDLAALGNITGCLLKIADSPII